MTDLYLLDTAVRMVKREGPWQAAFMPGECVQSTDTVAASGIVTWTAKNGMCVSCATIDAIRAIYVHLNRLR